jgi:hypothetical protein
MEEASFFSAREDEDGSMWARSRGRRRAKRVQGGGGGRAPRTYTHVRKGDEGKQPIALIMLESFGIYDKQRRDFGDEKWPVRKHVRFLCCAVRTVQYYADNISISMSLTAAWPSPSSSPTSSSDRERGMGKGEGGEAARGAGNCSHGSASSDPMEWCRGERGNFWMGRRGRGGGGERRERPPLGEEEEGGSGEKERKKGDYARREVAERTGGVE